MNTKDIVMNEVVAMMNLGTAESNRLRNIMMIALQPFEIINKTGTEIVVSDENEDQKIYQMFFVAKRIQGVTDRTIKCYNQYLSAFLKFTNKPIQEIDTNDIRYFLAVKKERDKNSDTNVNNYRRVLSSFFGWLTAVEYIMKNPMSKVAMVRTEKKVKKAFTEEEIEKMRSCIPKEDKRLAAVFELLLSTGCRVSEIVGINIDDIQDDEITVFGKGKKERVVYLNAKARLAIKEYLDSRNDDNPALFVTKDMPHDRLMFSSIEVNVRKLGKEAGVRNVHPHRFRRTCATLALNRGMPIEQVQIMLGHESIDTTTIYATSNRESVKMSHKRYVI